MVLGPKRIGIWWKIPPLLLWTTMIYFRVDCSLSRLPSHSCQPFPSYQYTSRGPSTFAHPTAPMWPSKIFFDSVYCSLRTNITTNEFNLLPHWKGQKRATRAYEKRYRRFRSISAHDEEKRRGMKRIDFLMGRIKFHSISQYWPPSRWMVAQ